MTDLSLHIILSTLTDYIELADLLCTSDEWAQLGALDQPSAAEADNYILLETNDSGEGADDPVMLTIATASAILPDIVAGILRRAIEANHVH